MLVCAMISLCSYAQTETHSVLQSDISGKYRNAVKNGYYEELNNAYGVRRGYHGSVDIGYTFGIGDYDFGRFEINTTHGYQFNPYFFIGGGVGLHLFSEYNTPHMDIPLDCRDSQLDVPLYATVRVNILNRSITPFIDGRIGYYLTHGGGLYAKAAVGCRFHIYDRHAMNIAVGYSYEDIEFNTFDRFTSSSNMNYTRYKRKLGTEGISVTVGYEF